MERVGGERKATIDSRSDSKEKGNQLTTEKKNGDEGNIKLPKEGPGERKEKGKPEGRTIKKIQVKVAVPHLSGG